VLPALSAEHEYEPTEPARGYQKFRLMRRRWRNENSHIVWEFEAHK
jgi:hypothetical protein